MKSQKIKKKNEKEICEKRRKQGEQKGKDERKQFGRQSVSAQVQPITTSQMLRTCHIKSVLI